MDTLGLFLASVDGWKVEGERTPSLKAVMRESFTGPAHKAMLATHELNRAKFARERTGGDMEGPARLRVATAELHGHNETRFRRERLALAAPSFTAEQLRIADAAYDNTHRKAG